MNKKFEIRPRAVHVNLENGYYFLGFDGGVGKTYLYNLLSKLGEAGKLKFCGISYHKAQEEDEILKKMRAEKYELIFLDRFDLYVTYEICKEVERLENSTIILLGIKDLNKLYEIFPLNAFVEIKEDVVEVSA